MKKDLSTQHVIQMDHALVKQMLLEINVEIVNQDIMDFLIVKHPVIVTIKDLLQKLVIQMENVLVVTILWEKNAQIVLQDTLDSLIVEPVIVMKKDLLLQYAIPPMEYVHANQILLEIIVLCASQGSEYMNIGRFDTRSCLLKNFDVRLARC